MDGNRLDALDAEAFELMIGSKPFHIFMERIDAERKRVVEDCTREDGDTVLRRKQGAATALQVVLEMPGTLLKEMKSNKR